MTPTCPNCANALLAVVGSPESAPWLCTACHRGWWPAELTDEARSTWNPMVRAFIRSDRAAARAAVAADRSAALERGTSLLPEQLGSVSAEALAAVAGSAVAADVSDAVAAELARRKPAARRRANG